jgi:hypothetical protein
VDFIAGFGKDDICEDELGERIVHWKTVWIGKSYARQLTNL